MPWPGSISRFVLPLVVIIISYSEAQSEGYVGCLFSDKLCLEGTEICYDDDVFGRCLSILGSEISEEDLRYELTKDDLHTLSKELKRLFALGYRWSHAYTQCRLQGILFAIKNDLPFEVNECSRLSDQDLEGAVRVLENEDDVDPREVAIVKFTPSAVNPNAQYADEIYYPPVDDQINPSRNNILPPNAVDILDMEDPYVQYSVVKRNWIPQMHRRSVPEIFNPNYNTPGNFRMGKETKGRNYNFYETPPETYAHDEIIEDPSSEDRILTDEVTSEDVMEFIPMMEYLNGVHDQVKNFRGPATPQNFVKLQELFDGFNRREALEDTDVEAILRDRTEEEQRRRNNIHDSFSLGYNTPDGFRAGWESRDAFEELPESRVYYDENDQQPVEEYGSGLHPNSEDIVRKIGPSRGQYDNVLPDLDEDQNYLVQKNDAGEYAFLKLNKVEKLSERMTGNRKTETDEKGKVDPGLYTEGGVIYLPNTHERGDTKLIDDQDIKDLLNEYGMGFKRPERLDVKKPGPLFQPTIRIDESPNVNLEELLPSMQKKEPRGGAHPSPSHEGYHVDTDFVYVTFKNSLKNWDDGNAIIRNISKLLNLEPGMVKHGRVDTNEVTFKIKPNMQGINATEVANRIGMVRSQLENVTGVHITGAGVGDRIKLQTVHVSPTEPNNEFYIIIFTICGILGALLIGTILLLIIRRHIVSREKLHGLTRPDTEASKDYQDLCRARMAVKGQTQESVHGGRITSLSRESEQSPSSRSSTSSWSEEPALHNMDISTGHMVLSYMEDHLRNKDRLEQEWVALCAYVAEPCDTSIAHKKENVEKNRYQDILPYDHSRVVLNELSNSAGSNYINASSITDHDPRNPAYIATQGPLPHTAPDFWQLIWEQGAVVIVMLTRLTESGTAMCHRYWPEEGSELYHIYEVHLVSEHIWCDDYLVRSFYLKNVRTGETRTVTQFHFLSWSEVGVPSSTKALLEFRRKVNKSYRGRSCPIVVHCSDGAGRTGTYCLIDMVLCRMAKGAKEIDIAATLEHLRDQRPRMVATKQQFEFVLTAVAEEVHAILKALPPQPTPPTQQDKEKDKETK